MVTVGYTEQDTLLALDVVPVGVTEWYGEQPSAVWPWAQDELGDAAPTVLDAADGINVEAVAALEPDLIIGTNAGLDEETYDALSGIAPTIAHSGGATPTSSRGTCRRELIGRALGKRDEALALIAEVEGAFADAAAAHPEFAGTTAVFLQNAVYDGSFIAYQDGLSTDFLTDLGFVVPAEHRAVRRRRPGLHPAGAGRGPQRRRGPRLGHRVAQGPARAGGAGRVPGAGGGAGRAPRLHRRGPRRRIYFASPLSLPYVLDELVPRLEAAVAGDPATVPAAG